MNQFCGGYSTSNNNNNNNTTTIIEEEELFVACCGLSLPADNNNSSSSSGSSTFTMESTAAQGEACDVIIIPHSNPNCACACSDFIVQFPDSYNTTDTQQHSRISISINGNVCEEMQMKFMTNTKGYRFIVGESLKPSRAALQQILPFLLKGKNSIRYSLIHYNVVIARANANLFLWNVHHHVIVCDVDGTITKSNARGVLDTMILKSYAHVHEGVCEFLSTLVERHESLQILYLTSRPVSYAHTTRKFLHSLQQEDYKLPQGPLLLHPGTLSTVLYSELVTKDVHQYKSDALMRQVVLTFAAAGRDSTCRRRRLLVSGFGNALTDSVAYEMAGISRNNIYMIDKKSQISCMNNDLLHPISEKVKVNSQGSLQVVESSSERSTTTTTDDVVVDNNNEASWRRNEFAFGKTKKSSSSSRKQQRKTLHRQYTALIGSSYNGYHDVSLLEDVSSKIRALLQEGGCE